jgi:hypothetical protein
MEDKAMTVAELVRELEGMGQPEAEVVVRYTQYELDSDGDTIFGQREIERERPVDDVRSYVRKVVIDVRP